MPVTPESGPHDFGIIFVTGVFFRIYLGNIYIGNVVKVA